MCVLRAAILFLGTIITIQSANSATRAPQIQYLTCEQLGNFIEGVLKVHVTRFPEYRNLVRLERMMGDFEKEFVNTLDPERNILKAQDTDAFLSHNDDEIHEHFADVFVDKKCSRINNIFAAFEKSRLMKFKQMSDLEGGHPFPPGGSTTKQARDESSSKDQMVDPIKSANIYDYFAKSVFHVIDPHSTYYTDAEINYRPPQPVENQQEQKEVANADKTCVFKDGVEDPSRFDSQLCVISKHLEFRNLSLGLINIQMFYTSAFMSTKSVKADVAIALEDLVKNHDIQGLIIDLRHNPGGSVEDVVAISNLFVQEGTLMQLREYSTRKTEKEVVSQYEAKKFDLNFEVDMPVVVLVDESSASASEILAGTLRDYNRALIVGTPHTYGKGSVQTLSLSRYFIRNRNGSFFPGAVALTTGLYYLPSGRSIQNSGVSSDIVLRDLDESQFVFEKSRNHSLPAPAHVADRTGRKWLTDGEFQRVRTSLAAKSAQRRAAIESGTANDRGLMEDLEQTETLNILADWVEMGRTD